MYCTCKDRFQIKIHFPYTCQQGANYLGWNGWLSLNIMAETSRTPIIGLEIHARIATKSKMFCRCANEAGYIKPNTNICPICTGMPGQLPLFNGKAFSYGIKTALALNCEIPETSRFDRKNYFYPDLPKGFQISQYNQPVALKGKIAIFCPNPKTGELEEKTVGITRLHLEDDAGKLTHMADVSLVDYNRCGTPLMEIVTDPDIRSAEEAKIFMQEMRSLLRTIGTSEANMEMGQMRCDANINLIITKHDGSKANTPISEIKNLNSFRAVEKAILYEIERQYEQWQKDGKTREEVGKLTVGWDPDKEITFLQRTKEETHDYRYFPEPDLPAMTVTEETVEKLRSELPELPLARLQRMQKEYGLFRNDVSVLVGKQELADYYEAVARASKDAKASTRWILNEFHAAIPEGKIWYDILDSPISPEQLAGLIRLINDGKISGKMAKDVFAKMLANGDGPDTIIKEMGIEQVSDKGKLESICQEVIKEHPGPANDVRSGKTQAIGFLVGQAMQKTKGQANPGLVNQIFKKLLK